MEIVSTKNKLCNPDLLVYYKSRNYYRKYRLGDLHIVFNRWDKPFPDYKYLMNGNRINGPLYINGQVICYKDWNKLISELIDIPTTWFDEYVHSVSIDMPSRTIRYYMNSGNKLDYKIIYEGEHNSYTITNIIIKS